MSYRNPTTDTHGQPLDTGRRYRLYCGDRQSYLADLAEGEDGELLVRIGLTAGWGRYDEMQVERVAPVDQYGADIPAAEGDDAGAPSIELLQADLDELANLRNRMQRIIRAAAKRLGLMAVHAGDNREQYLDGYVQDEFEEMLMTYSVEGDSLSLVYDAKEVMDWIDNQVEPISRTILAGVNDQAQSGRQKETSAA